MPFQLQNAPSCAGPGVRLPSSVASRVRNWSDTSSTMHTATSGSHTCWHHAQSRRAPAQSTHPPKPQTHPPQALAPPTSSPHLLRPPCSLRHSLTCLPAQAARMPVQVSFLGDWRLDRQVRGRLSISTSSDPATRNTLGVAGVGHFDAKAKGAAAM
eukprot:1978630-Rhodomonas_salina.5